MDGSRYQLPGLCSLCVVSIACILLFAGCGEDDSPEISTIDQARDMVPELAPGDSVGVEALDSLLEEQTMQQGTSFIDINDISYDFSEYEGSVVMIDFWRTDTKVCIDRLEILRNLHNELHPEGFEIIAIALNPASKQDLRRFAQRHRLPYPVIQGAFKYNFGPVFYNSLPVSHFYDRNGLLVWRITGSETKEDYLRVIRRIMKNT